MKKLLAIGEALIDFIPTTTGVGIQDVESFLPIVGGAPANVCGAFVKLGGRAAMITQLGQDPFGDKIIADFEKYKIDCEYVSRTEEANTSLAFVALKEDGNREFSFYRKPGADMLLQPETIQSQWFTDAYALHFCSVSLGDFPMREAHKRAIEYAEKAGILVSFDPNLRKPLWKDEATLYAAVKEFLPKAHIVKISDEELEFITGKADINEALSDLFVGNVKLVIYTRGAEGAEAFTIGNHWAGSHAADWAGSHGVSAGCKVKAVDTTGAGDAFIGSFLFKLAQRGITKENISALTGEELTEMLDFSNSYCGKSVLKQGAIASYPTGQEMHEKAERME